MTIDMDPIIFEIGSRAIGWHGVMMVTGIIVAILLACRIAIKEGISPQAIYTSAFWIVLFGLIGARLTHVIDEFGNIYEDDLLRIFAIWEGGMGWYGGLLGGIVGGVAYAKLAKIPLGKFADTLALPVFLGLAIGRLGCTINGDAYGSPTSLPWGFAYTHPASEVWELYVKGHPAPVYEIIWIFSISTALWAVSGKKLPSIWLGVLGAAFVIALNLIVSDGILTQFWVTMLGIAVVVAFSTIIFVVLSRLREWLSAPGSLFCATVALYSFGRFFISWVRDEHLEDPVLGPLHQAHLISIILFVGSLAFLAYLKARSANNEGTSGAFNDSTVKIEEQHQNL